MDEIIAYFKDRVKEVEDWGDDLLSKFCYWYAANGLLFAVRDSNGICGAICVRTFRCGGKKSNAKRYINNRYYHDPYGDTYHVELLATDTRETSQRLYKIGVDKLGPKKYFSWRREKNNNRPALLDFNRFKTIHMEIK